MPDLTIISGVIVTLAAIVWRLIVRIRNSAVEQDRTRRQARDATNADDLRRLVMRKKEQTYEEAGPLSDSDLDRRLHEARNRNR